jgi:hypothetical protein
VHERANAAGTLGQQVGVSRVTSLENYFQPPEERSAAPSVLHLAILYFYLYAQVTLNPWNGVNDDSCHCFAPFLKAHFIGLNSH